MKCPYCNLGFDTKDDLAKHLWNEEECHKKHFDKICGIEYKQGGSNQNGTGMNWKDYNRRCLANMRKETDWNYVNCRIIQVLEGVIRKR